jgi:uncharacterized protein (TIGR02145 family)
MKTTISTLIAIALSLGVYAQNNNMMFIHKGQVIHEFSTQQIDSIVFYRTQEQTIPPISVVVRVDNNPHIDTIVIVQVDTLYICDSIITLSGCNDNTLGWGTSFGVISFATDSTWTITNGTTTQIWSDVVQATNCNKTIYAGGDTNNYNADCRSNPDHKGDLFSWCAVHRFQNELCPNGWRVPGVMDFISLDIAMGGTGQNRSATNSAELVQFINSTYLNSATWGGNFSEFCNASGTLSNTQHQKIARYWSSSVRSATPTAAHNLYFSLSIIDLPNPPNIGAINPQSSTTKFSGLSLRCVRDN